MKGEKCVYSTYVGASAPAMNATCRFRCRLHSCCKWDVESEQDRVGYLLRISNHKGNAINA